MSTTGSRSLARSLAPLADESLPGYLLRLAHRLDRTPARLAQLTRLVTEPRGRAVRLPAHLLVSLRPDATEAFASATRLSLPEAEALGLRQYCDVYPPLAGAGLQDGRVLQNPWGFSASTRYCPTCLDGDGSSVQRLHGGAWQRQWHLPVVFACTLHQRLLEDRCPTCHQPVNAPFLGRAGLIPNLNADGLHPLQCRNHPPGNAPAVRRTPRPPCAARFTTRHNFVPTADLAPYLALQERIQEHLSTDSAHPDGPSYFNDLVAVAKLITISWPAAALSRPGTSPMDDALAEHITTLQDQAARRPAGQHGLTMIGPPPTAAACGALLLRAEQLLNERNPQQLRAAVHPLAAAAGEREPLRFAGVLRRQPMSESLARALSSQDRAFLAAGRRKHARVRLLAPSREATRYTATEVPQIIPTAWHERHLEAFTAQLRVPSRANGKHVRRAAALKLVEMTAGGTWADCATTLDMPRGYASTSVDLLRERCPGDATWHLFQSGVEAIAAELDADPDRVDYARRRRTLSAWSIPQEHWSELVHGLAGSLTRAQVRTAASVLVWTQVTEGEAQLSPLMREGGTGLRVSDYAVIGREINQLLYLTVRSQRVLRERLAAYAADLAARCDRIPSLTADPTAARP
ncbi:TniQ family protein [Kitasatospora purpeofusca]|uniref:TniQ family protein n=1 Tax=Kitasatospora purpeofusca TaxID=67352 RepID=A0ABZ1UBX3_9ACTN|nr:TniQ family protein [Kitasatospora purpeofusca]